MFTKFVEVYEEYVNFNSAEAHKQFLVREVFINRNHIIYIKEDLLMLDNFMRKKLPKGFTKDQKFTLITLNKGNMGQDLSVVGSPEYVYHLVENLNVNKV